MKSHLDLKIEELNKKSRQKKSRIKSRHNVIVDNNIKTEFKNTREKHKYIKEQEKFLDRNSYNFRRINKSDEEKSFSIPKELYDKAKEVYKQEVKTNKKLLNEIKDSPIKSYGLESDNTVEDFIDRNNDRKFGDLKFNRFKDAKSFRDKLNTFNSKESILRYTNLTGGKDIETGNLKSDVQLYENYITAMENIYKGIADDVIEKIKDMSVDEFLRVYYTNIDISLGYVYNATNKNSKNNIQFNDMQETLVKIKRAWI